MYHRRVSDMILSHSCSTFIQYASPPRRGALQMQGFRASSADDMKVGPEHRSFSEHFYGAIPLEYWHGNFPSMAKMTVTPGGCKGASLTLLSHTALTGCVWRIYVAKPLKLQRGVPLVISRRTAPHAHL
jgi:hypothetical protein